MNTNKILIIGLFVFILLFLGCKEKSVGEIQSEIEQPPFFEELHDMNCSYQKIIIKNRQADGRIDERWGGYETNDINIQEDFHYNYIQGLSLPSHRMLYNNSIFFSNFTLLGASRVGIQCLKNCPKNNEINGCEISSQCSREEDLKCIGYKDLGFPYGVYITNKCDYQLFFTFSISYEYLRKICPGSI